MAEPAGRSASERAPPEERTVGEALDSVTEFYRATGDEDSPIAQMAAVAQKSAVGLCHADETPRAVRLGSGPSDKE